MNQFEKFDRDFKRAERKAEAVLAFVVFIKVAALVGLVTIAVAFCNAVKEECPDGLAKCSGRAVKDFKEGMGP